MASHLANIFGTEQDRVNCSFYYKIGACRHGDRCSRKHIRPPFSQTILLPNVYHNPAHDPVCKNYRKGTSRWFRRCLRRSLMWTSQVRTSSGASCLWQCRGSFDRECIRTIWVGDRGTSCCRQLQWTVVCRPTIIRRTLACDRFSRSLLPSEWKWRMQSWWLLQFYALEARVEGLGDFSSRWSEVRAKVESF